MAPPLDFSGVIPPEFSTQIIEEAVQASAVLSIANLMPMGTTITELPIPKTLPTAGFVTVGGRKPWTDLALQTQTLHAEEIAAITAIPDSYLEDASINLWGWVRPRIAEAIAQALDNAVLWGLGAPATYPAGGLDAVAAPVAWTTDALETINLAMGQVEGQGLPVTAHSADLVVRGKLRGVRASTGELLLGTAQAGAQEVPTIYGLPVAYASYGVVDATHADFFTGDFRNLIIGVRQDIRYALDPSAVVADNTGKVLISGFQDNQTPLKVWARFGCAIVQPVTVRKPTGANPFSKAGLTHQLAAPASDEPAADSAKAKASR